MVAKETQGNNKPPSSASVTYTYSKLVKEINNASANVSATGAKLFIPDGIFDVTKPVHLGRCVPPQLKLSPSPTTPSMDLVYVR